VGFFGSPNPKNIHSKYCGSYRNMPFKASVLNGTIFFSGIYNILFFFSSEISYVITAAFIILPAVSSISHGGI